MEEERVAVQHVFSTHDVEDVELIQARIVLTSTKNTPIELAEIVKAVSFH